MKITISKTKEEACRLAADFMADAIRKNPTIMLGLATGSTPLPLYACLVEECKNGLDFSRVRSFNLDEYCGLPPTHEQSYRRFMDDNLFSKINIDRANTRVPDGLAADIDAFCAEYDAAIKAAGGIDIQVLGIGSDGHIAFNEPGSPFDSRTRKVALAETTIADNARFFASADEVPRFAISQGIGTIMEARCNIMLCFGANKAKAVKDMIEGPVSTDCPASILQKHDNVLVFLDEAAAAELSK